MPKKMPNPSKVAAAQKRTMDAIDVLGTDPTLRLGRVDRVLGNKGFIARYGPSKEDSCPVYITGKVLQGGRAADFYVERGDWLIYRDSEVQGIITSKRTDLFRTIKKAGLVPVLPDLDAEDGGEDDGAEGGFTFEDAEDATAEASWRDPTKEAKSLREAERMEHAAKMAQHNLAAYRRNAADREARVAAHVEAARAKGIFDPEYEEELRAIREAQSAADKARAAAGGSGAAAGGAEPEVEAEPALPVVGCWEEAAI